MKKMDISFGEMKQMNKCKFCNNEVIIIKHTSQILKYNTVKCKTCYKEYITNMEIWSYNGIK